MSSGPGSTDDVAASRPDPDTLEREVFAARLEARLLGGDVQLPRVDRFVLERLLGAGGMGTVWLAHDEALDRRVALKLVRRGSATAGERMRLREARGLARITHPNVIAVHDVGEHEGRVWLAMEFVPGRTLRQCAGELARDEVLAHWISAGHGLAAIHAAGLVHRDIKPDNVLLGDDGRVRVIDLGLARTIPGSGPALRERSEPRALAVIMTPGFVGTRSYAAPEQQRGDAVDGRADQYAFCVALVESLRAARAPAGREHEPLPAALLRALARGRDPDPAQRFADMPTLLAALTRATLHTRPARRARTLVLTLLALALALAAWWSIAGSVAPAADPARAACIARARPVCEASPAELIDLNLVCTDPTCSAATLRPAAALLAGDRLPFDISLDNQTPHPVTLRWHPGDHRPSASAELSPGRRPLPPRWDVADLPLCLDIVDGRGRPHSIMVDRAAACD